MDRISAIMNWLISLTALGVAIYSLYLQRRDKKPRLRVEAELGVRQIALVDDGHSGHTLGDDCCLVLTLRNPSEKDITIDEIRLVRGRASFKLQAWGQLPTVPSHKAAEVIIPSDNLEEAISGGQIGYFQVKDILGNKSSSSREYFDFLNARSYFSSDEKYQKHLKQKTAEKDAFEREDS